MYYSEKLRAPMSLSEVRRVFGINPLTHSSRALEAGIFNLETVPVGYEVSHYERKNTNTYRAVPKQLSTVEVSSLEKISVLESVLKLLVSDWSNSNSYSVGSLVEHNNTFYTSSVDSPTEEPGTGDEWSVVGSNTPAPTPDPVPTPTTYTVTVQNVSGYNKYFIDGVQQDSLTLTQGETYIFDQSDSSNTNHPLRIYTDSSKSTEVTAGVTVGSDSVTFVPESTGTFSYQCQLHSAMGGDITVN